MTIEPQTLPGIEIPRLEDWITFPEAAVLLGYSGKQGVHQLVFRMHEFDFTHDVRVVGGRPLYLLRLTAVLARRRRGESAAPTTEKASAGSVSTQRSSVESS